MNKSKLGTAGMVMGILGFVSCGAFSLPGLVVSLIALYKNRNDVTAAWGIILCTVPCLFWFWWWMFYYLGLRR